MNENQLKFLWDNYANNKGFNGYDEFKSLMANNNSRKVFFENSNKELGFKDYNEFESILGVKKKDGTQAASGQPVQQPGQPSAPSFGQKVVTDAFVSGQPVMKGVQKKPVEKKPYQDITYKREELPSETTQMPETPVVKAAKKDFKQTQLKPQVQLKSTPEELEEIQKKTEKADQTGLILNDYQSTGDIYEDLKSLNDEDVNVVFTRIQRRPDLYAKYSGRTPDEVANVQAYDTRELYEADRDLVYKNYLADLESQSANHNKAVAKANVVVKDILGKEITPETYGKYTKEKKETTSFGEITVGPVIDMDKVDETASAIAEKYNLPTDGDAWRLIKNELNSGIETEIIRPDAEADYAKNYPEFNKKRQEMFESGFKADEQIYAKVDSILTSLENQYQQDAKNELNAIDAEYKTKADQLNAEYEKFSDDLKKQQDALTESYQAGQIDRLEYETNWNNLSEQNKVFYENYKKQFPDPTAYVTKANEINSKYNRKYQLQRDAIAAKAEAEMKEAYKRYALEYKEDPELLKQINDAYRDSFERATEARAKKMGMAAQLSINPISSLYQSTASSLGGVFKGWGGSLDSKALEVLGESMEQTFMMPQARAKEFSDWVDPQNLTLLTGQLAGSVIPGMTVGAAVAIGTQGAGAPVAAQLIAGGLAGWATETVDVVGRSYLDRFEKTNGNIAEANLAAERSLQAQYDIMFTYAFDALPFVGKALKFIPSKAGRVVAGGTTELVTETAQEYPQNIADENIQAGNEPWTNLNEALKDTKRMKETLISVGPAAFTGVIGQLGSKSKKSELTDAYIAAQQKSALNTALPDQKRQYVQNMVFGKDAKFANGVVGTLFATGQIDEQTSKDLMVEIERAERIKESGKSAGLSGSKLNVYGFYSARAEEAERNSAKFGQDPILHESYKQMAKQYRDAGLDFMKGGKPDLLTITYADGSQAMMMPEDANALFSDATALDLLSKKAVTVSAYKEGGEGVKIVDELKTRAETYAKKNRYTQASTMASPLQTLRENIQQRTEQLDAEQADLTEKQRQAEIKKIEDEEIAAFESKVKEFEAKKRDERDLEIEQLQQQREALGVNDVNAFFSDMKPLVATTVERMETGQAAPQSAVKAASDYLYAKYKELTAMKSDSNRMMTIAQIESVQAQIEQDLQTLAGNPPSQKTQVNDQENIQGIPSEIGVGQEPVAAEPVEVPSAETPEAGGVLQAQEEVTPEAASEVKQPEIAKDIYVGSITQTSLGWESATEDQGPGDMRQLSYTANSGVEVTKGEDGKTYAVAFTTKSSDGKKSLTDISGRPGFFSVSVNIPDGATQEQIDKAKQKASEQLSLLHPFIKAQKGGMNNTSVLKKVLSGEVKIKPTTTAGGVSQAKQGAPQTQAAPQVEEAAPAKKEKAPETKPEVKTEPKTTRKKRIAKMFEGEEEAEPAAVETKTEKAPETKVEKKPKAKKQAEPEEEDDAQEIARKKFYDELGRSGYKYGQYGGNAINTYYIKDKDGKVVKEIKIKNGDSKAATMGVYKWIDSQAGTNVAGLYEQLLATPGPVLSEAEENEKFVSDRIEEVNKNGKPLSEFKVGDIVIRAYDGRMGWVTYIEGVITGADENGDIVVDRLPENPKSEDFPGAYLGNNSLVILKPKGEPAYTGEESFTRTELTKAKKAPETKPEPKTKKEPVTAPKAGKKPKYEIKTEVGNESKKDGYIYKTTVLKDGKAIKEFTQKNYRNKSSREQAREWLEKEAGPISYQRPYELFKQMFAYYDEIKKDYSYVSERYAYAAKKMVDEQGISKELADYLEDKIAYMGGGYVKSLEDFERYSDKLELALDIDEIISREGIKEKTIKEEPKKQKTEKTSEEDGERLNNFKKGDVVYRNYNGRYEEYTIKDDTKSIWKLVSPDGRVSDWNAGANGGFILLEKPTTPKKEKPKRTGKARISKMFQTEGENAAEEVQNFLEETGINIEIIDDEQAKKLGQERNIEGSAQGRFMIDKDKGTIYINRDALSRSGKTLVYHEGIHPVINIIRNTNPELYRKIINGLKAEAKRNPEIARAIRQVEAVEEYQKRGSETIEDESVVEVSARLASGEIDIDKIDKSLKDKLIDLWNRIAKALGIPTINTNPTSQEFRDFIQKLSTALNEGGKISDIVGKENVKAFASPKYVDSQGNEITAQDVKYSLIDRFTDPKSGFTFEYLADNEEFEELKKNGQITNDRTLDDFVDKYIYGHSPDAAFTGNIKKKDEDGKEITIVEGKGGVFYPIKFIKEFFVWASTASAANSMAKQLNENAKKNEGPIYLALVSAPEDKLLSSTTSSNGVIDIFKAMSNDFSGFGIPKNVFKNALLKAAKATQVNAQGKKVGLNLKTLTQANTVEEIESAVRKSLAADASIFDDRKTFSLAFIRAFSDGISGTKSEQKVGKFLVQGVEVKGYKQQGKIGEPGKEKYKLSPTNMVSAISQMMGELMLRGESSKKIYAIIEVTPNPKGVASPSVQPIDSSLHESYPKAIKLAGEGMKVKVHILQDRELWTDRLADPETGELVAADREKKVFPTSGVTTTSLKVLPKKPTVPATGKVTEQLSTGIERTNDQIRQLMEDAMDAIDEAIASGTDAQIAVNDFVGSQDWYNELNPKYKNQFDEFIKEDFGVTPRGLPKKPAPKTAPKAPKAPKAAPTSGLAANISSIVENYYKIKDGDRAERAAARDAIDEILDLDPKLKYIYKNISDINKQLQEAGVITDKTDGCP